MRLFGIAAMLGVAAFAGALLLLQGAAPGTSDWTRQYVSHFAHGPLGWLFATGVLVHATGNVFLGVGLERSLRGGTLPTAASVLFLLAAGGLAVTGVVPVEPMGAAPSAAGAVHRAAASVSFLVELAALLLFSAAFAGAPAWRAAARISLALAAAAAAASALLLSALLVGWRPGLAERAALAPFMAWEFWAGARLAFGRPRCIRHSYMNPRKEGP